MPRKGASITQADIARAIRAVKAAGLPVVRVTVRADGGVSVETHADEATEADAGTRELAAPERIVPL